MPMDTIASHTAGHAPVRASARFMLSHPAHLLALGFGSGLSPVAPGTAGTLWGWLAWLVLQQYLNVAQLGLLIIASLAVGWWACTVTARHLTRATSCGTKSSLSGWCCGWCCPPD